MHQLHTSFSFNASLLGPKIIELGAVDIGDPRYGCISMFGFMVVVLRVVAKWILSNSSVSDQTLQRIYKIHLPYYLQILRLIYLVVS